MIGARTKTTTTFYRKRITRHTERATRRFLFRAGGLTRTIARRKMRRGKPQRGKSPRVQGGQIKNFLLYALTSGDKSVVIGPTRLGSSNTLRVLDRGGVWMRWAGWGRNRRRYPIQYDMFPVTQPGLDEAIPKLPAIWADSFKGGK